jgi:hypothetical protein
LPLTLGARLNWISVYRTHVSDKQFSFTGRHTQLDAYAVWRQSDSMRLRLSANNLAAPDLLHESSLIDIDGGIRETARTTTGLALNWQLRLELKL